MTKEQLEIVKALKTIKQECDSTYDCYMCPYEKTICFDETPNKWDLITLTYKLSEGGDQNGN